MYTFLFLVLVIFVITRLHSSSIFRSKLRNKIILTYPSNLASENLCLRCFSFDTKTNSTNLKYKYNLSKRKFLQKPSRMFSLRNGQNSSLLPLFQPNLEEMRRVFDKFDRNKDGKISPGEYKAILKALGKGSTTKDVQKIFEVADLDGDGFIDFNEFMEVNKREGGLKTIDIQSAFRTFDLNGDGKISVEEVFELLRRLGESCSLQDCRRMVRAVDTNEDGAIDMDEFMTMMTRSMKLSKSG